MLGEVELRKELVDQHVGRVSGRSPSRLASRSGPFACASGRLRDRGTSNRFDRFAPRLASAKVEFDPHSPAEQRVPRGAGSAHCGAFEIEQIPLPVQPTPVSAELAVLVHDSVAGDYDRDPVEAVGPTHRPYGFRVVERGSHLLV